MKTSRKIMVALLGLGVIGGAGALAVAGPGGFGGGFGSGGFGPGKGGPAPRFREMDVNKDGVVTKNELAAYKQKRFAELDANKDGKVDASEIDRVIAKRLERKKVRMRYRFLARLDDNGDGIVTKEEFEAKGARLFRRADVNADGKVSREELARVRRFGKWQGRGMKGRKKCGWKGKMHRGHGPQPQ